MKTSHLLDELSRMLSATVRELNPQENFSPVVKAMASYVKNHKVNPSNLFEIVNIFWPTAEMSLRDREEKGFAALQFDYVDSQDQVESFAVYDVLFEDGSQGFIVSIKGLTLDWNVVS